MEQVNTIGDIRERGNECEKERASRLSSFCRVISISSFIILAVRVMLAQNTKVCMGEHTRARKCSQIENMKISR